MWNDPIVEETRKLGDEIAARFNYDVVALGRYYQQQQVNENRVFARRPTTKPRPQREDIGVVEGLIKHGA